MTLINRRSGSSDKRYILKLISCLFHGISYHPILKVMLRYLVSLYFINGSSSLMDLKAYETYYIPGLGSGSNLVPQKIPITFHWGTRHRNALRCGTSPLQ